MKQNSAPFYWPHTGAILAGGQSKRMGSPKEAVLLSDGRPMIEHVIDPLLSLCAQVVIIGKCSGFNPPENIRRIDDIHPGEGPLAGLEALLQSGLDSSYLVVSCDQPFLTAEFLYSLVKDARTDDLIFFSSKNGEPLDPFPGHFPASLYQEVKKALERGERSVRRFIKSYPAKWVTILKDEDVNKLKSINSRTDLPC